MASALAKAIASSLPDIGTDILVVDDYQNANSAEAEAFLSALASSASLRVLVTSRIRPAWITARMEVYGEAIVFDKGATLVLGYRSTRCVAGNDVHRHRPHPHPGSGMARPHRIGSHSGPPDGAFLAIFCPALYEFFAEDLFQSASHQIQDFLLWLALAGDGQEGVVRAIVGACHEQRLAESISSGFLSRAGNGVVLHPLLRAFLTTKLRESPARRSGQGPRSRATPCDGKGVGRRNRGSRPVSRLRIGRGDTLRCPGGHARVGSGSHGSSLVAASSRRGVDGSHLAPRRSGSRARQRDERRAQTLAERAAGLHRPW